MLHKSSKKIIGRDLVEKQTGFDGYPNRQFASLLEFGHEFIIRQKKLAKLNVMQDRTISNEIMYMEIMATKKYRIDGGENDPKDINSYR